MASESGEQKVEVFVPTLNHIAAIFSVSYSQVQNWRRGADPAPAAVRGKGYDVRAWHSWWRERQGIDEAAASNSPALELQRQEKAKILRIQRLQLEGRLVDLDAVHDVFAGLAGMWRELGQKLELRFGADAGLMVSTMLDNAEKWIKSHFANSLDDRDDEQDEIPGDNEPVRKAGRKPRKKQSRAKAKVNQ